MNLLATTGFPVNPRFYGSVSQPPVNPSDDRWVRSVVGEHLHHPGSGSAGECRCYVGHDERGVAVTFAVSVDLPLQEGQGVYGGPPGA
jgi:hypothetical protein